MVSHHVCRVREDGTDTLPEEGRSNIISRHLLREEDDALESFRVSNKVGFIVGVRGALDRYARRALGKAKQVGERIGAFEPL